MKSPHNRTIDLSVAEGQAYLDACLPEQDAYSLDEITDRIICGDTFAVLPHLPKAFIDLLIVDPPYNLYKKFGDINFAHCSTEAYRRYTTQWITAVQPLLKPTASVYVCCDWASGLVIAPLIEQYFHLRNRITWQREKGRGASANWKNGMEDIWFATNTDTYTFNLDAVRMRKSVHAPYRTDGQPKDWEDTAEGRYRNTCPSNFWNDISVPYWSMPENTPHPTQKPEKLLAKLLLASSNRGDFIFDPFLGSGSAAVTAKKLDRHFCGIEQNAQYCVWAQKRLSLAETDRRIQGYEKGVFWERNANMPRRKK